MAFPAQAPVLTDEQSIDVIIESEVSIIQCMADLFCNTLINDIALLPTIEKQTAVLKKIMCGFNAKESAIAAVVGASAKKSAVDLGIDPSLVNCCLCNKCNCEKEK
ncbi:hypothetical protein [Oceanirhabdus sp. W0125-5]|uniref:hypothetical protein n=1 Tax=Oceanirhabdus sp. W0125-5 TaxID=2999116 RepID=UPI0022F2D5A4|nr:hypothetical protein [Oceanirhabdus sp. W0125-5]WBW96571.1 hypothetical protein OW730_23200 [Oceanirhabdus sp. W0125-5]